MTVRIVVRPDANAFYAHARGEVLATGLDRDEAEELVRAAMNGGEWQIEEEEED